MSKNTMKTRFHSNVNSNVDSLANAWVWMTKEEMADMVDVSPATVSPHTSSGRLYQARLKNSGKSSRGMRCYGLNLAQLLRFREVRAKQQDLPNHERNATNRFESDRDVDSASAHYVSNTVKSALTGRAKTGRSSVEIVTENGTIELVLMTNFDETMTVRKNEPTSRDTLNKRERRKVVSSYLSGTSTSEVDTPTTTSDEPSTSTSTPKTTTREVPVDEAIERGYDLFDLPLPDPNSEMEEALDRVLDSLDESKPDVSSDLDTDEVRVRSYQIDVIEAIGNLVEKVFPPRERG